MSRYNLALVLLALATLTPSVAMTQEDFVQFGSRNFMEGELKYMERGRLYFKTTATDTIYIEWDDVVSLSCSQLLEVELQNGILFYGTLEESEEPGKTSLRRTQDTVAIPLEQVVRITAIEEQFLARFDGTLSAGLNATKANKNRQFNLGLDLEYVTRRYESSLYASTIVSDSQGNETSEQAVLNIDTRRKLPDRWHTGALIGFERNEELGIEMRSTLGWGMGRSLVQTNSRRFILEAGLLYTREEVSDSSDSADNIESYGFAEYELFSFDNPEIDLTTGLRLIPSLSDWGRLRGEFNLTLNWEIINDLSWQLTFKNSYDSRPPGEGSNNDYSLFTGVAWDI